MSSNSKIKRIESRKQYFFALRQMVSRDIKKKYARSYRGIVWSVLNPLMTMAVMSMIFSTMFKKSIENFPIYYLTGSILWGLFNTATSSAMTALVDNKNLLLKVKLSKQTFVISKIITALTNFGYTCIAYVLMLVVFQIKPNIYMLFFPIAVLCITLFSAGIGFMLSIVYVFFGDIKHLYSVLLTLWMYMSAIFFPVENLPLNVQKIVHANPIYACVYFSRECVMNARCPDVKVWIQMFAWGIGMFIVGYYVFKKKENTVMQKV